MNQTEAPDPAACCDAKSPVAQSDPSKTGPLLLREVASSLRPQLVRLSIRSLILNSRDEMRIIGEPLAKPSAESIVEAIQLLRPPIVRARHGTTTFDVIGNASTVVWFRLLNPMTGSRSGRLHCMLIDPMNPSATCPPTTDDWRALDEWVIDLLLGRLKGSVAADVVRAIKGSIFQSMPRLASLRRKIADILVTR